MEKPYILTEKVNETVLQIEHVDNRLFEVEELINSTDGIHIKRLRTEHIKGVAEFYCTTNRTTFHREEFERNLNMILA